ncbi:LegC family aminotransferase [Kineobactrum salinum]|uniref:GDP-perosamine synthase n=1 Tax=Kineobactrum salinum TaxID=2708301 RepID=A0A6C0U1T5_9GAMM|nr:LegC family aminotransferase [Kineobactrum salinum]QIB65976.1 LegC family aminotransferase [Kineobactrum salinum]
MSNHQVFERILSEVRAIYGDGLVPLHRPTFSGNEKRYLTDCIDSNFVSSVGERVTEFENRIAEYAGAGFAIATVNGTAALHAALQLAGVKQDDEVITQALTFVAGCNAIRYCGAEPVFLDVSLDTFSLSPDAVKQFLETRAEVRPGGTYNRKTGRRLAACVPMHTFGIPGRIDEIVKICRDYSIPVIEDAAESLGSYRAGQHTGTFGMFGTLSFNGNKVITTGGGGMLLTNDRYLAEKARHITTTAKVPHGYEFVHDEVGYNYRMPNLNAALGCAQMEQLQGMLDTKATVAARYQSMAATLGLQLAAPLEGDTSNFWLNAVVLSSIAERDELLEYSNSHNIMMRPVWRLMPHLTMYARCYQDGLRNSLWLEERIVNLPSSVPETPLRA